MITEITFKEVKAIELENEKLKLIVIPSIGGKIASIFRKDKEFELLFQNKENKYKEPKIYDDFGLYDASGFDDAFPTIDECVVKYGDGEVIYPNHGEIWSGNFEYKIINETIILYYISKILNYSYEKIIYLSDDKVIIEYNITNLGENDIPCIWAMHCLINCEEDMELVFPRDTKSITNVLKSDYLGEVGQEHTYPVTKDITGKDYYLNRVFKASSKKMEKYYVSGAVKDGYCGVIYPSRDISFMVYFQKDKLPYLGFWITEGGFRGDYNCALEPTNGYYDNIPKASKENSLFILKQKEKLTFDIKIELK